VKAEICENHKQISQMRKMESIAENPNSLDVMFGRGQLITCNGAIVAGDQVTTLRTHTSGIPSEYNGSNVLVDPISFVIKPAAAPVRCNDIAPPRWRLNECWYCTFLQIPNAVSPDGPH
jgi:hypothetical protein